jgi:S-adenosylmethionine/arginine decarboxylase-like enzyme
MIEHKHLIVRGQMMVKLTPADVYNLLHEMVDVLDMELMKGVPSNPNCGYEGGENPGVTGCALITTSHIVLHTWDNDMCFQFDAYSCKSFEPNDVYALLKKWGLDKKEGKFFDREYNLLELIEEQERYEKQEEEDNNNIVQ